MGLLDRLTYLVQRAKARRRASSASRTVGDPCRGPDETDDRTSGGARQLAEDAVQGVRKTRR
jgi:hypothetical protein